MRRCTWLEYALLIFADQHLANDEQVTFSKCFGALEFALAPISNVRADGSVRGDADDDEVIEGLKCDMGWRRCIFARVRTR